MDKTNHKRMITAIAVLTASITTASVAWKTDLWFIILMKALEGVAATIFLPSLMSLLLGICESPEVCAVCFDFAVKARYSLVPFLFFAGTQNGVAHRDEQQNWFNSIYRRLRHSFLLRIPGRELSILPARSGRPCRNPLYPFDPRRGNRRRARSSQQHEDRGRVDTGCSRSAVYWRQTRGPRQPISREPSFRARRRAFIYQSRSRKAFEISRSTPRPKRGHVYDDDGNENDFQKKCDIELGATSQLDLSDSTQALDLSESTKASSTRASDCDGVLQDLSEDELSRLDGVPPNKIIGVN